MGCMTFLHLLHSYYPPDRKRLRTFGIFVRFFKSKTRDSFFILIFTDDECVTSWYSPFGHKQNQIIDYCDSIYPIAPFHVWLLETITFNKIFHSFSFFVFDAWSGRTVVSLFLHQWFFHSLHVICGVGGVFLLGYSFNVSFCNHRRIYLWYYSFKQWECIFTYFGHSSYRFVSFPFWICSRVEFDSFCYFNLPVIVNWVVFNNHCISRVELHTKCSCHKMRSIAVW